MKIVKVVVQQGKGRGDGQGSWSWHALDQANRRTHTSIRADPGGWSRLDRTVENLEAILGAEVELVKHRGEFTTGQVIGRDISVEVRR